MGRKLNLSHLSDEECKQVLAVIQRDFNVRQNEKDRIIKIQGAVENEAQKRLVLSRQLEFNKKHCICCFSTFGLIFNKKVKCEKCNFFICKDCKKQQDDNKEVICLPCDQQRELQERACQWYYDEMKAKFRRFGSAKVVRSLYKRQSESGTSESEHNSDSGVDHPFSPLLKKGGAFKRDGSADTIDEETNTDPDWLKNYKPPSESIGVQFPDDDVDRSGKDYFDLLGEDRADGGERLQDNDGDDTDSDLYARRCHARLHPKVVTPDNQQTKPKANKTSQSNTKRDSGSSSTSSSSSQNTLQPPDKARDGVCMLSPIQEVSSPESSETQDADSVSKRTGADGSVFRFPQSEEGKRDGETLDEGRAGGTGRQEERVEEFLRNDEDGETTSPGEADSGIHMSFSSEDRQEQGNQDTPLRQPIRALDEMSESMEAFAAGVFRDIIHEEQPNSLETNVCSPRKNMSDVAPKGKAMFTQKYEASDRNGNLVEIEPVELSCSSDEDDFDDDIDQEEHCAMNFEEFMKQIQDTGTSKAREGSPHKKGSKSKKSKDMESKHDRKVKDDSCSSPKRKAFSKRSHSAGDFRARPEDQKKEKKPVKLSRSASNRFIRYDSLPLVVEVYEADAGSPSPSFKDSPRKQRFVYDGSPEIEATPEQNDQGLSATSGSSEESHSKSRQASVESGTTEGTFPKSTSISSLSSTTDGDRRRSADSVALKSSFDSDYDLINSPNHSVMKLCSPPGRRTDGDKPGEGDSKGSPEDCSEDAPHGNMGDRRQLSLVKQDQVPEEYESNCGEKKEERSGTPKTQTEEELADCNDTTENTSIDSTGDKGTELEEENPEGSLSAAQMSTPRKNKESIEIANLTKKFCMKQEEVLKSAEEVLSSASQLSEIQNHIDKLEQVLNSLERKVAGEGSSMSSFESDEIYTPPPSPNTASSLVSEDVECLHRDLVQFPAEVTSPSEINMASAVRMITATALKVLSTTEDVMDAHLDEDAPKPDDQISPATGLDGYESGPMDLTSPQSQTSASPSSTGSMIFRVTSGKDSPPTATLLFSYDDMKEAVEKPECLDSEGPPQDLKGDDDDDLEKEETTVMVLEDDNLFADDVIMSSDREDLGGDLEVSVFDHHFSVKNGIVDPLTLLYNQVTELEEKVYLSAGKVYTLEERLLQLEQEVETIDDNIAEEILAALEDKLALTVAQVSQNEVEVSSVENEIAGLESSGAGKVMSSVYSLDNTLPFRVSTATYYFNQPDLDQYAGGLIEVRIPSDGLIESMKAADPDNYKGLDSDWGTVVVRRIGQTDSNDDDGKAEFHWSDLIENRGGNSETDENENGLERPENESIDSDVSEASEKYRSTFILVVDPDGWKEPATVEANFRKQDE
ncbi:uncharacterized protein [Apostichopus japonicus]|uniref:uncharacterized protein isoform X4 n=1 Tax=Stichopus japonicus TaxID=307972 RepID=UPI003AB7972B